MITYQYLPKAKHLITGKRQLITGDARTIIAVVLARHARYGDAAINRLTNHKTDYTLNSVPGWSLYTAAGYLGLDPLEATDNYPLNMKDLGLLIPDTVLFEYLAIAEYRPLNAVVNAITRTVPGEDD